jgi:serine/threonine-protein kinase
MDLLQGEPLDRYLKRERRVAIERALPILEPIAEALDSAHRCHIIHRDLKPQNIFLAQDGTGEVVPKLLDFGMAKLVASSLVHTVSGTPIGTPLYMSPEQARGDRVDARSDIYAFGVLCYEMLVGQVPFDAEATVTVLMAHLLQAPPVPSEACAELARELDAPLLAMLQKDPSARPASAGDAVRALRAAAERAGISLLPAAPAPKLAASSGRDSERALRDGALALVTTEHAPALGFAVKSRKARREPRARWQLGAVLLVLGAGIGIWLVTARSSAPSSALTPPKSATPLAARPQPAPRSPAGVELSPPAAPPDVSASATAPNKSGAEPRPKKRGDAAASASAIPRDLENPF